MSEETTAPRRGGRPSRLAEAQIRERILDAGAALFLEHGYGPTSIEAIAKAAGISKRTFYHRFADKAEVFGAVIHQLIAGLRPPAPAEARLFTGGSFAELLPRLAQLIVHAALNPKALALHRIIVAEATRFPELATIVHGQDARRDAIRQIGRLLAHETREGRLDVADPAFAAEQFLQLLVSAPQRRALGLGTPMTPAELDLWAEKSVALFLNGCRIRGTS